MVPASATGRVYSSALVLLWSNARTLQYMQLCKPQHFILKNKFKYRFIHNFIQFMLHFITNKVVNAKLIVILPDLTLDLKEETQWI